MIPCVYKITNTVTGLFYIGSAKRHVYRWRSHLSEMKKGIHGNYKMLRDYKLYGKESFLFEIVEEVKEGGLILLEREQWYIDNIKPTYNIAKFVQSGMLGRKHTAKTKALYSLIRKGQKRQPHSEETKQKLREANTGKKATEEAKIKMGLAHKGRICSIETRRKLSENCHFKGKDFTGDKNPFYGKKHNEEVRKIMSVAKKGKPIDPVKYKSKLEFMSIRMRGERNSFYGKKHSEDTKRVISEKNKERKLNGWVSPLKGIKRSEETKRKVSEAKKGKKIGPMPEWHKERIKEGQRKRKQQLNLSI